MWVLWLGLVALGIISFQHYTRAFREQYLTEWPLWICVVLLLGCGGGNLIYEIIKNW